jgi:putative drug exporter of the RND superfamily
VATFLYRLGALAARRRFTFLGLSLAAVIAVLGLALSFPGSFSAGSSIPGSPAQAALEKMDRHFPEDGGISGDIVFQAPEGSTIADAAVTQQMQATLQQLQSADHVVEVGSEEVSEDGRVAVTSLSLDVPAGEEVDPAIQDAVRALGADFNDKFEDAGGRVRRRRL